jgi:predicted dehydrogenase
MKNTYFEIGFIGGAINSAVGTTHKIATQMDGRFRLVAGCFSRDIKINNETGQIWAVDPSRVYRDWQTMLEKEREQLDAVVILTPTPDHMPIIEKALRLGYPVISEKALTKSVEEAKRLKDIIDKEGSFLSVTFNYTGYPTLRELRQRIKRGDLGNINQVLIEMPQEGFIRLGNNGKPIIPQNWRLSDYEIPTISLDLGVHIHNIISFVTDSEAIEVIAINNSFGNFKQIVDDIHAIARFTDHIVCNIWFSKSALGYRNGLRIRVFGTEGSAEWIQHNPEELTLNNRAGEKKVIIRGQNDLLLLNDPRYNRFKSGHPAGFIEAFANLYSDIYDSLYHYKYHHRHDYQNEYTFGINDALKGLVFLSALHQSFKEHKWINVKDIA